MFGLMGGVVEEGEGEGNKSVYSHLCLSKDALKQQQLGSFL